MDQAGVGDLSLPEVQPLKSGALLEVLEGRVRGAGLADIQRGEFVWCFEMGQSAAGDRCASQGQALELDERLKDRQPGVGEVVALQQAELLELREVAQGSQAGVGNEGLLERQGRQRRQSGQLFHAGVGDPWGLQLQHGQVLHPGQVCRPGIADPHTAAKVQDFQSGHILQGSQAVVREVGEQQMQPSQLGHRFEMFQPPVGDCGAPNTQPLEGA